MTADAGLPRFGHVSAHVIAFDESAGWGTVRTEEGTELFFHCTQIADGSRTIPVGAAVTTQVRPVGLGTWEATEVTVTGRHRP